MVFVQNVVIIVLGVVMTHLSRNLIVYYANKVVTFPHLKESIALKIRYPIA